MPVLRTVPIVVLVGLVFNAPPTIAAQSAGLEGAAAAISEAMRQHHYDPAALADPAYRAIEARVAELATHVQTADEFVSGFNAIWRQGPFSHVRLTIARASAADTATSLDALRVGDGATLGWDGDVAVLTVKTMMGVDTVEQITRAYAEVVARDARALIIDLRANDGGAFAVRPLVGHLLDAPLDAGAFVSRQWAAQVGRAPTRTDVTGVTPWDGWSLVAFWRDVEASRVVRLQFAPTHPTFRGPVFVLIGPRTSSAAELGADALAATGRAVLVGETTAGRMLSQKPFDIPGGFQLFLPIADFYSFRVGRIEGQGVAPHVRVAAAGAMTEALVRARP